MSVTLEEQTTKTQQAYKSYDDILDWKRYMKYMTEGITILNSFQLKKVRTVLHAWLDLNEIIEDTIQKSQAICGRIWYVVDSIMEILHFHTMELIKNACPLKLMIKQVECRSEEAQEKIQGLNHINIGDVDQFIRQLLNMQGKIHIFIYLWHKLAKNEMEKYRCDIQLGFESPNYPNIDKLLEIWNRWQDFLGYQFYVDLMITFSWGFILL